MPATSLQDPEGWYKTLEVSPSSKMIDPAVAVIVDKGLREKWHSLITMYHSDRAAEDAGGAMQAKAARINEAYRELKTRTSA